MKRPKGARDRAGTVLRTVRVNYDLTTHTLTIVGMYQHLLYDPVTQQHDTVRWIASGCHIQVAFDKDMSPFSWTHNQADDGKFIDSNGVLTAGCTCDYTIIVRPKNTTMRITVDPQIEVDDVGIPN